MIKFFRKIRYDLIGNNKTKMYFKYAVGEIVLVVVGILIALSINNWNEKRLEKNELMKIYNRVLVDMDNDINDLLRVLNYHKTQEHVFKKVINDSVTPDLFDDGLTRILTQVIPFDLNNSGVEQLKELTNKDAVSLSIISIYDYLENQVLVMQSQIRAENTAIVHIFRDNYSWFPEWHSKTIMKDNSSKELQDYFLNSMEYKHRVIQSNQDIYNNYVPAVAFSLSQLTNIRNTLKFRTDENTKQISKKDLEQYSGFFKVTRIEGDDIVIKEGVIYEFVALENVLRMQNASNQNSVFNDFFYTNKDTFIREIDGFTITLTFEKDNTQLITGGRALIESDQDKSVLYIKKQNL